MTKEIKVAQLAGFVSEHTAYHHGEVSLHETIINMAQDFVGSNNVPLLVPNGQFGTRHLGGHDAASARYIFTYLQPIARQVFKEEDESLLKLRDDDGMLVEPEWFVPVVPMVLVNGAQGIGTGFSTTIPSYDPIEIIRNIRKKLGGEKMDQMIPWYRGFKGSIENGLKDGYVSKGKIQQTGGGKVEISELPVSQWTQDYKMFLVNLPKPAVKRLVESHTDTSVHFSIEFDPDELAAEVESRGGLEDVFKLQKSISLRNMHMFTKDGKLQKFHDPREVPAVGMTDC